MMNNGAAYLSPLCGVLQVGLIYVAFGLLLNIRMIHKAVLNGQVWHCTFGVSCRFCSWVHEVVPPQSSIRWSGLLVLPKDNISLQWVNLVSHLVRRHTQKCQVIPVVIFSSLCRVWSERSRRKSAFLREVILHVAQSLRICTIFHNGRNNVLGMGIQNFIPPSIQSHPPSLLCNQPAKHRTSRFYTAPSAPEIRASLVERWSPGPPVWSQLRSGSEATASSHGHLWLCATGWSPGLGEKHHGWWNMTCPLWIPLVWRTEVLTSNGPMVKNSERVKGKSRHLLTLDCICRAGKASRWTPGIVQAFATPTPYIIPLYQWYR